MSRYLSTAIGSLALFFLLDGRAYSGTLTTSSVPVPAGFDGSACECVNISNAARDITVDIVDAANAVVVGTNTANVPAGQKTVAASTDTGSSYYCRADVSKNKGRLGMCALAGGGGCQTYVSAP